MINNVDWRKVFEKVVDHAEKSFGLSICVETAVINEIEHHVDRILGSYDRPNSAKIAGVVAFWIRKLKPLTISPDSNYAFSIINEYISVKIGLGICSQYFGDSTKPNIININMNHRILKDLMYSFRYHSHSPHGSMMIFEALTCES